MVRRRSAILALVGALTVGGLGATFAGVAAASPSGPAGKARCVLAQDRVNLIVAAHAAAADRLVLLDDALALAKTRDNSARVQLLDAAIAKVQTNQGRRAARLAAIELACGVQPAG